MYTVTGLLRRRWDPADSASRLFPTGSRSHKYPRVVLLLYTLALRPQPQPSPSRSQDDDPHTTVRYTESRRLRLPRRARATRYVLRVSCLELLKSNSEERNGITREVHAHSDADSFFPVLRTVSLHVNCRCCIIFFFFLSSRPLWVKLSVVNGLGPTEKYRINERRGVILTSPSTYAVDDPTRRRWRRRIGTNNNEILLWDVILIGPWRTVLHVVAIHFRITKYQQYYFRIIFLWLFAYYIWETCASTHTHTRAYMCVGTCVCDDVLYALIRLIIKHPTYGFSIFYPYYHIVNTINLVSVLFYLQSI